MKKQIINGINYRLNEETLTAEVIALKEDFKLVDGRLVAQNFRKAIFNGYEGDIIVPETVVFEEKTYRVTSIGEKAFARSYSLKSVTIPDSVTSIGNRAFEDCQNLKSITIPDYASIGEFAFGRCESLPLVVSIDKEIGGINYRLYFNRTAEVIYKKGYKGDIIIPETIVFKKVSYRVTSIGERAFEFCSKLTNITIPDGVVSIGDTAFEYCKSLTKITLPDSVMSIGDRVFDSCEKLTSITIPVGVKSIGCMAFSCCCSLTSVIIPDSVTSIDGQAFEQCSSLTSIIIPKSVKSISDDAFVGCSSLTSIVVVDGNTVYDSRENCNAIIETGTNTLIRGCQSTIIPNSVTSIGENAFAFCKTLTSITIPDGVKSIGAEAFRKCDSLESITIPASVRSIEGWAFDWCKKLNSITFQGTIVQWEEIELGFCWRNGVPTAVIHCTDGDVSVYSKS